MKKKGENVEGERKGLVREAGEVINGQKERKEEG